MKKIAKRLVAFLMAATLLVTAVPALAEEFPVGEGYFDFESSEYLSNEKDETLEIKVYRHGSTDGNVDVSIKAADFLSTYSEDYEILIDGRKMKAVEGKVIDPKEFVYEENGSVKLPGQDSDTESDTDNDAKTETAKSTELPINANKSDFSTGSALRDAQAAYLDLPENTSKEDTEDASKELLGELYGFLDESRGAEGKIRFTNGEQYHSIIVKLHNNDKADGERLFLLGLMGTDNEKTSVAANATTYVTISDDEDIEPATFTLEAKKTTLTKDAPTAKVTVRRTTGLQYFSTAYVSTVTETAKADAYENLSLKEVAFAPGQETATVDVTGLDFSKGGSFGLRLEAGDNDKVKNHYLSFELADNAVKLSSKKASLRSKGGIYIGDSSIKYGGGEEANNRDWTKFAGGVDGSNSKESTAQVTTYDDAQVLYLHSENRNCFSGFSTKSKTDLFGVTKVRYSQKREPDPKNKSPKGSQITTYVGFSNQKEVGNNDPCTREVGLADWHEGEINVASANGLYYFKFEGTIGDYNGNNHKMASYLHWITFYYAKYNFNFPQREQSFMTNLYAYTEPDENGGPKEVSRKHKYTGPALTMKKDGQTVNGMYANGSATVVLEPSTAPAQGYELEGAYFGNPDNGYYVEARNGRIQLKLDRAFLWNNLVSTGVISSVAQDSNIDIYPVYKLTTTKVIFNEKGGSFNNVNKTSVDVLTGSEILVSMTPYANNTAAGISYETDGTDSGVKFKTVKINGVDIPDYTTAQIPISGKKVIITPNTEAQNFYAAYWPTVAKSKRPLREITTYSDTGEIIKTETTDKYSNIILDITKGITDKSKGSDEDGSLKIEPIRTGDFITLMAAPPNGYYVKWTDMTGDADGDGTISEEETVNAGTRRRQAISNNPTYVYGNILPLTIDEDNTKYYYEFIDITPSASSKTVTGRIMRENNTFYNLVQGKNAESYTPVSGAYVNIGGVVGNTNKNGYYSVNLDKSIGQSGIVGAYFSVDGSFYSLAQKIESFTTAVMPALDEHFTARSINASYIKDKTTNEKINGSMITAVDEELKLEVTVGYNSTIKPKNAHFTIVKPDGKLKVDCDDEDGYTTAVSDGDSGTVKATLTFNPLKDIESGDRVFVAFEDTSGNVYNAIDLGYCFKSELSLGDIILPALGPKINDAYTSDLFYDIIGDPLGEIELGKLSSLGYAAKEYFPNGILNENKAHYQRLQDTLSWNFSKKFEFNNKRKNSIEEDAEKIKTTSENDLKNGETTQKDSEKTPKQSKGGFSNKGQFSFSITPTVGFRLTLTQRNQEPDPYEDGKYNKAGVYFEDLTLYVKCEAEVSAKQTIQTPIGISVFITASLTGDEKTGDPLITGIYRMYTDYDDDTYEFSNAVPYDESFDLFKTSNDARRHEGYIFLNPVITVQLGVGVGIAHVYGQARFAFDMDFHFTDKGNKSYGNLNISGAWGVKILCYDVYSKDLGETNKMLFRSGGATSPFGYDVSKNSKKLSKATSDAVNDVFSAENTKFDPTVSERDYLKNRSEWKGMPSGIKKLQSRSFSKSAEEGSTETVLRTGVSSNPQFSIVPFGNKGQAVAVFVDDVPTRTAINSRAVYYTVRDTSGNWSEPQVIDDDGTIDDYPYAKDLGNGKIMIAWSSADEVLEDDATLEYALQCLALETATFDTTTQTMSKGTYLTHATDLDITGDLNPCIAFDSESNKAILYYIKTEYKNLEEFNDISEAYSAVAYLLYDAATDTWSNTGDSYTDEELDKMNFKNDEEKAAYLKNWYGQRFLDLRLDDSSGTLPLVICADAVDYNGMGLFAYTVDWDKDQSTLSDRDVFLQTYDFATGSFTGIFRISPETGCYVDTELEESDNTAYLFYGAQNTEAEQSEIRMLDIGNVLTEGYYNEVTNGNNTFNVLQYEDGRIVPAEVATTNHNMHDYTATVTNEGKVYLLWTDTENEKSGRDIYASVLNNTDGEENAAGGDTSLWTKPVKLTSSDKDDCYEGLGIMTHNDNLVILANKSNYSNEADSSLVQIVHKMYSKLEVENVEVSNQYCPKGDFLTVTATLKNVGLLQYNGGDSVTFNVDGDKVIDIACDRIIRGGDETEITHYIGVPDSAKEISAECNGTQATAKIKRGAIITAENEEIVKDDNGEIIHTYKATLFNNGNRETGLFTLSAESNGNVIEYQIEESIQPGSHRDVEMYIPFYESCYTLDENTGYASMDVTISAADGDFNDLYSYETTVGYSYDAEAIAAIKTYKGVSKTKFTMKNGDFEYLDPIVAGGDNLTVEWIRSLNPETAWIDYSGAICAQNEGTAELVGIVLPKKDVFVLDYTGSFRKKEISELVPNDLVKYVQATVTVNPSDTDEAANKAAAKKVTDMINALPASSKIKTTDKAAVEKARKAYDALTKAQKAKVTAKTLTTLKNAEAALKTALDKYSVTNKLDSGLKATANKDGSITVKWGAAKADRFAVYASYCDKGSKFKKVKTLSGKTTSFKLKKLGGKKLNDKKNVKFYVVAYRKNKGKYAKYAQSYTLYAAGVKNKTFTNAKSIKVNKTSVTLKKGKTAKIKPTLVLVNSKKKSSNYVAKFRYRSTNLNVAKVDKYGKITAKGKGTCWIYVLAANGKFKSVKVTVK